MTSTHTTEVGTEREPNSGHAGFALAANNVVAGYGAKTILGGVDLQAAEGKITALVGPNGCGKSTMLRACSRLLDPTSGSIVINGDDVGSLSTRELARRLALLSQTPIVPGHLSVRQLVEQGRYAHVGALGMLRRRDDSAIERAIELTGLIDFVHRDVDTLSGGERQRAWLALALAQEAPLLLLDEPTNHLDAGAQWELLELIKRLNIDQGTTVLTVLHELNHAAAIADRVIVIHEGAVVADGEPWSALTVDVLRDVFRVDASIVPDPRDGQPVIIQHGSATPQPTNATTTAAQEA